MFMGDRMKIAGWISFLLPLAVFILDLTLLKGADTKNRIFKTLILLAYICVILYETVLGRSSGVVHEINMQPLWSWERFTQADIRWQIYMNVFLFVPLGFLLSWSQGLRFWQTVLIGFLLSTAIETTQYIFCLGLCEIDDVIHNTLGTMIGYGYWSGLDYYYKPKNK